MNFTPLVQRLLRAATRSRKTFRELSAKQWIVQPAETLTSPPAVYLPGDLDRITAVMEDTTLEQEMSRVRGGPIEHAATIAYQLRECQILDGSLYKGALRYPLTRQSPRLIIPEGERFFKEASLASSYYGSFYFGHWMTDDLTLQLLGEETGNPVSVAHKPYGHEMEYCKLFGINREIVTAARFGSLVLFDDFGQNASKKRRYEALRSRLRAAVSPGGNRRVYIRRGSQGVARTLSNAAEIEEWLGGQGFVSLEPERCTPREIAETLSGAEIVLGLEGSHLIHSIFNMAVGGTLVVLQPPYRFNNVLKNYTDCLGIRYGFVTGTGTEGGFSIDLDHLKQLLGLLNPV